MRLAPPDKALRPLRRRLRFSLRPVAGLALPLLLLLLSLPLAALEIRLQPPHRLYAEAGMVKMDSDTTSNVLSALSLENLRYNIPLTITYYFELYEARSFFVKRQLKNLRLVKKISYDLWSGQYFLAEAGRRRRFKDLAALEEAVTQLRGVPLIPLTAVAPEKKYYIKSRLAIKIKNLSSYYYLINNLISIFRYRTTYYQSPTYTGAALLALAADPSPPPKDN